MLEDLVTRFSGYSLGKRVIMYGEALKAEAYELLALWKPSIDDFNSFYIHVNKYLDNGSTRF